MGIYRDYENPNDLQNQLDRLMACKPDEDDEDALFSWNENVEDLKQRINFAWQDDEYDCES